MLFDFAADEEVELGNSNASETRILSSSISRDRRESCPHPGAELDVAEAEDEPPTGDAGAPLALALVLEPAGVTDDTAGVVPMTEVGPTMPVMVDVGRNIVSVTPTASQVCCANANAFGRSSGGQVVAIHVASVPMKSPLVHRHLLSDAVQPPRAPDV